MDALHPERGSVVLGALTKLVVVALIAVAAFDAASIGYTHVQASDHGSKAALAAGESWSDNKNPTMAFHAATASLAGTPYALQANTFRISSDDTVSFEVHATAKTLVVQHLSFARHWADVVSHISSTSATPGV